MSAQIEKMIKLYEDKIEVKENGIKNINECLSEARLIKDQEEVDNLMNERDIANAQIQAYTQAKHDFKSLI